MYIKSQFWRPEARLARLSGARKPVLDPLILTSVLKALIFGIQ